jgi:hypothetical protein
MLLLCLDICNDGGPENFTSHRYKVPHLKRDETALKVGYSIYCYLTAGVGGVRGLSSRLWIWTNP